MRRRFRRNRGIWLPGIGREPEDTTPTTALSTSVALSDSGDYLNGITGAIPVLLDTPRQRGDVNRDAAIGDILTNEYFLQRIVGKIYVDVKVDSPTWPDGESFFADPNYIRANVIVYVGFCIARADDQNSEQPLGITSSDGWNYQVDNPDNTRQPWIWRRSWVLQPLWLYDYFRRGVDTGNGANNTWPAMARAPSSNYELGFPLQEGPHIDCKTKRRVRQEDRLWMITTVRSFPAATALPTSNFFTEVNIQTDLRFFGGLRRARNNGQYA